MQARIRQKKKGKGSEYKVGTFVVTTQNGDHSMQQR
jgi:hypothetical protein